MTLLKLVLLDIYLEELFAEGGIDMAEVKSVQNKQENPNNVNSNEVINLYKKQLADALYQNNVLNVQVQNLNRYINKLKARLDSKQLKK